MVAQKILGVHSRIGKVADGGAADAHAALAHVLTGPYPARHGVSSDERASDEAGSARVACEQTLAAFRQHVAQTPRTQ